MNDSVMKQILRGSEEGGKTYTFNEDHDSSKPAQMWFQESNEGLILFIVFYSQACRWSKCLGCNLPSKSSQYHVGYRSLTAQVDYVFSLPEVIAKSGTIKKIIVSNNGSILDQETFSSTALIYLMAKINLTVPNLAVISFETRPEYVESVELEFLKRSLEESDTPTALELTVGFEAFDERIRNDLFKKGLSLEKFEKFISTVAPYKYSVKCYLMQKPVPGMSDKAAIDDVVKAIDYLSCMAEKYAVNINMHLNPTYAAYGTPLEYHFAEGSYSPPFLMDVARAALHAKSKGISIFIGLYDEGLAVPGGSFVRDEDTYLISQLELFNKSQDFEILERLVF